MVSSKQETVRVGNVEVTPITPRERRGLAQRLKRRYAQLRKQYPEIRGKRVDWIDFSFNDGLRTSASDSWTPPTSL